MMASDFSVCQLTGHGYTHEATKLILQLGMEVGIVWRKHGTLFIPLQPSTTLFTAMQFLTWLMRADLDYSALYTFPSLLKSLSAIILKHGKHH